MYFLGDKIKLNWKKEDYPILSQPFCTDEHWNKIIIGKIVFMMNEWTFRFQSEYGYEQMIDISEIESKIGEV